MILALRDSRIRDIHDLIERKEKELSLLRNEKTSKENVFLEDVLDDYSSTATI